MNRYRIILTIAILAVSIIAVWIGWDYSMDYPNDPAIWVQKVEPQRSYEDLELLGEPISHYGIAFNDKQPLQIKAATRMGLYPMKNEEINKALSEGKLVHLYNTNLYYLHDVAHPYLTPDAYDLLAKIGTLYQYYSHNDHARLRVTSCLRTESSIANLRKTNKNAVNNSCHLYGTTFDISYALMDEQHKQALARALRDLQKSGYCYVKHEVKQPCFHITVRK